MMAAGILAAAPVAAQSVDLVLNVSDLPDPIPAGGEVTYTVRVTNDAAATAATGIAVTIDLPAAMIYRGFTGPGTVACAGMTVGDAGPGTLICTLPNLAANTFIGFDVLVGTTQAGTPALAFAVAGAQPDPDIANNTTIEQTTVTAGSDLSVAIAGPVTASSGAAISYDITVANLGPNTTAGAITVQYPVPTGFQITGGLPGGCLLSAGTIACNVAGPIANGGTVAIGPFTGQISAGAPSTVTHAISVASSQDPIAGNKTATLNTTVTAGSDVRITKIRAVGAPYLIGDTLAFTLTPSYTGDVPFGLEVVDVVPGNYTILTGQLQTTQGAWSCGVAEQTVTCTRGSAGLMPGADVALGPISIPVAVASAGTGVINTAAISTTSPADPNPANNTATDGPADLLTPYADLAMFKQAPQPPLAAIGAPFDFTITVGNRGPSAFSGTMVVTDSLPVGLTMTGIAGAGWTCSAPAALPAAGPVNLVCQRIYLPGAPLPSGSDTPPIIVTTVATAAGQYENRAVVTSPDANPIDNDTTNNRHSVIVTVGLAADNADIRTIKTVLGPDPTPAGDLLRYRLEVINDGPNTANVVYLYDDFASLIDNLVGPNNGYVSDSIANGVVVPGDLTCSTDATGADSRAITCRIEALPVCTAGVDCPFVDVTVRPAVIVSGSRTNSAVAGSLTTADPNLTNNTNDVTSQVEARADVSVTKVGTPSPVPAGQDLEYVVTALNNGPSSAQAVAVTDSLPVGVLFLSATPSTGSCGTVPGAAGTLTTAGNRVVSCNLGTLTRGTQETITIRAQPTFTTYNTTITNIATVSTSTTEPTTPGATNNRATVDVPVTAPVVDLLVNKIDLVDPLVVGDSTSYRVIVTNNGPSAAENVVVVDDLPAAGLGFRSHLITSGSCTVPALDAVGGQVRCEIPRLEAHQADTLLVTMRAVAKGVWTNSVSVSSDETTGGFETNLSNNTTTENTTVRTLVDVEMVSKTPSTDSVGVRVPFTWDLVVRNNTGAGLAEADSVVVADVLPATMELTAAPTIVSVTGGTATGNSCTGAAGSTSFSCQLGTVSSGATVTIRVPVRVLAVPTAPGTISNTATVNAQGSQDVVPGNNAATGTVTVVGSSLSGSVFRDFNANSALDAGDTGIDNILITVSGTAFDGSPVSVTTTTDAAGNFSVTGLPAGSYTITRGPVGESHLSVGAQVAGDRGGNAAVAGAITGITLGDADDGSDYRFPFIPAARIGVAKELLAAPTLNPNGSFSASFRIRVTNYSLEALTNVTLTDTLAGAGPRFGSFVGGGSGAALSTGQYTVETAPAFFGACAGGAPNAGFNGQIADQLGTIASLPAAGGSCALDVTIRFFPTTPLPASGYTNQADGTGLGALSGQTPTDRSHNGADPDPDGDGDPTNNGTPTPVPVGLVVDVTTDVTLPATANAADTVTATVLYRNAGPSTAEDVGYTLTLVPGLSGVTFENLPAGASAVYDPGTGVVTLTGMPTTLAAGAIASGDGTDPIRVIYLQPGAATSTVTSGITTTTDQGANALPDTDTATVAGDALADVTTSVDFPATIDAGQTVTGTVIFTNVGPSDAAGVTYALQLEPNLPGGVTIGNLPAGASASYDASTGTVTFTSMPATLTPGQIASGNGTTGITVSYVQPATGTSTVVSGITTTTNEPVVHQPNQATATITGNLIADVTTTVTLPGGAAVNAGDQVTGLVVFTNTGPSTGSGMTYRIVLEPGLDPLTVTFANLPAGAAASYAATTGEVTFTGMPATLAPGVIASGNGTTGIEVRYTQTPTADSWIRSYIGTSTDQGANIAPDQAETPTNGVPVADVTTSLSFPATADAGTVVSGTIRYSNLGPSPAADVQYTLQLTPGLTGVVFGNLPAGATAVYDPTTGVVTLTGMPTTLASGAIASGNGTTPITLQYVQPGTGISTVESTISTSTDEGSNVGPNQADVTITGALLADVTTSVSFPTQAAPGAIIDGTVVFRNAGPSTAANVSYTLTLTTGLTGVVFGNLPASASASYDPATGTVTFTGMPAALTAGTMASGNGSTGITVRYTQPPSGVSEVTSAIGTSTNQGLNLLPDTAQARIEGHLVDVTTSLTLTASGNAGDPVLATVLFRNAGPSTAQGMSYRITLVPGLTDVVITNLPAGASASYNATTGEVTFSGMPGAMPNGLIASGNGTTGIEIRYTQPASGTSRVTSHIRTITDQGANVLPDDAEATVGGSLLADLVTIKTAPAGAVTAGSQVTYTILVRNQGPSDLPAGSQLRDVPTGLELVSAACSALPDNLCSVAPTPQQLTGTGALLPALPAGGSYEIAVIARVIGTGATTTNLAVGTVPPGVIDPNPGNDTSTVSRPIEQQPAIGLAKQLTSLERLAGGGYRARFTIVVRNYGSEVLTDVRITDPLSQADGGTFGTHQPSGALEPGRYRVVSTTATGLTADATFDGAANQTLATGSLAVGATATVELTLEFVPPVNGTAVVNQARGAGTGGISGTPTDDLSQDGADPDPDGNGDPGDNSAPTPVPLPAIEVSKTLSGVVNRGDGRYDATFSILVRNTGTAPLTRVQVTDNLAAFGSYTADDAPGAGQYTVVGTPIISDAVNGAVLTPQPAGAFTGTGSGTALLVSASSALPQGLPNASSARITFTLSFFPVGPGPFRNSAAASAEDAGGTTVSDESDTPAEVPMDRQVLGLAKSAGAPTQTGDRRFLIPYRITVRNMSSTVTATNVQVTDDLRLTFPTAERIEIRNAARVASCTGTPLTIASPPYDGVSQTALLTGSQALQPGQQCVIEFSVEVDFGTRPIPDQPQVNHALGTTSGTPGGDPIAEDVSQNGDDPDPDGNGDPTDNDEGTPVTLTPDAPEPGAFVITKTSTLVNVTAGQLVPYTITVGNASSVAAHDVQIRDLIPPGFRYRAGTASVDGVPHEPTINGRALTWSNLTFQPLQSRVIRLILVVGAGVQNGEYTNIAQVFDRRSPPQGPLSEIAAATVRVVPDPVFECSDIIGKVFDDRNGNGVQDADEPGLAGVRVATVRGWLVTTDAEGRYHIACAAYPDGERGSNFVMKLDDASLPTGYLVVTENPRSVRVTAGKVSEINFGVALPRTLRIELRDEAFRPGTSALVSEWQALLDRVQDEVERRATVVEVIYRTGADGPTLARTRLTAVVDYIRKHWRQEPLRHVVRIEEVVEMASAREGGR